MYEPEPQPFFPTGMNRYYVIYSLQENLNFQVFATYQQSASWHWIKTQIIVHSTCQHMAARLKAFDHLWKAGLIALCRNSLCFAAGDVNTKGSVQPVLATGNVITKSEVHKHFKGQCS